MRRGTLPIRLSSLLGIAVAALCAGGAGAETVNLVIQGTVQVARASGEAPSIANGDSFVLTITYDTSTAMTGFNAAAGSAQWHYGTNFADAGGGPMTAWSFSTSGDSTDFSHAFTATDGQSAANCIALSDVDGVSSQFGVHSAFDLGSQSTALSFTASDATGAALDGLALAQAIDGAQFDSLGGSFVLTNEDFTVRLVFAVESASFVMPMVPLPPPVYLTAAGLLGVVILRRRLVK